MMDGIVEHAHDLQQRVNDIFQHHQQIVNVLEADRLRLRKERDYWRQKATRLQMVVSKKAADSSSSYFTAEGRSNSIKT